MICKFSCTQQKGNDAKERNRHTKRQEILSDAHGLIECIFSFF